ncbi:MAG: VPLPA-CTERM sorting domain-containing protein [Geminicoccaceae bacterium]
MLSIVRSVAVVSAMAVSLVLFAPRTQAAVVNNPPGVASPNLVSIGSSADPALAGFNGQRLWRVDNANATGIQVQLQIFGGSILSTFTAQANGQTYFGFNAGLCSGACTTLLVLAENITDQNGIIYAGYTAGTTLKTKASAGVFTYTGAEVPLPAAAWLFGSALLGLGATARRRRLRGATVA